MNEDDYLPEGYRWATNGEKFDFLIKGLSIELVPIYREPHPDYINLFVDWAVKL